MARYNQTSPPLYDISKMRVPTVLVAGGNDWLGKYFFGSCLIQFKLHYDQVF